MCQPYQNIIKFPDYSSDGYTPLDTIATWLLYIVECVVVCKLILIFSVCACVLGLVLQSQAEILRKVIPVVRVKLIYVESSQ